MEILAIIPARGGSKGIPRKNIRPLAEHPLLTWTIAASLNAAQITRTVVSTDDEEIRTTALSYGAEVPLLRPAELSNDGAQTESALLHVLTTLKEKENYIPDAVVLLQPTSPIRFQGTIDAAITAFINGKFDAVLSVFEGHHFHWRPDGTPLYDYKNRPLRQDLTDENRIVAETGSLYVTKTETLCSEKNRLGGNIGTFETTLLENFDIDTLEDFRLAELIAQEWAPKLSIPVLRESR